MKKVVEPSELDLCTLALRHECSVLILHGLWRKRWSLTRLSEESWVKLPALIEIVHSRYDITCEQLGNISFALEMRLRLVAEALPEKKPKKP